MRPGLWGHKDAVDAFVRMAEDAEQNGYKLKIVSAFRSFSDQKQIWEDKGLIVIDRNVDVLVSKLRKKLQSDPSIKILNVHGRGYKMVIEA
jgi:hypothetical protein